MTLTDAAIRSGNPTEKPRKLSDGGGCTYFINPDGSRWWRVKYRYGGKEESLSGGVYRPGAPGHVPAKEAYAVARDRTVIPTSDLEPKVTAILRRISQVGYVLNQHSIAVS